jgi:high affinity Mn2+ porin
VNRLAEIITLALCLVLTSAAQGQPGDSANESDAQATPGSTPDQNIDIAPERWGLFWQATSIGQYHDTFPSPYQGEHSLQNDPEAVVSLTTTLFFGFRLARHTELYFNPEIAGGRGFSGVNGLANSSNGELPRVASATPKPYIARLYVSHDFGFGKGTESVDSDANKLAGSRPLKRYTISIGRFTVTDFFDNNRYSHDPRTQFLGWGVMYNGAWDYPADVRGYTWGWVHDVHLVNWSFRYASAAMPREANGLRFDRRLFVNRGDVYEVERRYSINKHPGAVRMLGYTNHANAGTYSESIELAKQTNTIPDITATRKNGTLKYGFGFNTDQEITKDIGIFGRLGWNDGKTESFAFTAIDRLATAGVSTTGQRWHRPSDIAAAELTTGGISAVHAEYLALGGQDFLIGDGRLNYGTERIWEAYYNADLFRARYLDNFFVGFDYQHVTNPAYNRDRGPLNIYSLRLHWELGKPDFIKK